MGILSGDDATCTFPTGQTVSFDPPVMLSANTQEMPFNFSIAASGVPCLTVKQTGVRNFQLTTTAGTVSAVFSDLSETITCPAGMQVSNANSLSLSSCDGGLGESPGFFYGTTETSVSFGLSGSDHAFQCQK
jgi:hypothetical protein